MRAPNLIASCVACSSALERLDDAYTCRTCGQRYPTIDGIGVFTLFADAFLAQVWNDLASGAERLARATAEGSPSAAIAPERANRRMDAFRRMVEANSETLRRHCASLRSHVERHPPAPPRLSTLLGVHEVLDAGWPLDHLLPYFHYDWGKSEALAQVVSVVSGLLSRTATHTGSAVVLGSGAGGLAHFFAETFETVIGVDLSIPTLLLSRAVLSGETMQWWLPTGAGPARMTVDGPAVARENIALVAADLAALPLPTESVDLVTTQYVMDILRDPVTVTTEIARVLKPNGTWLNFGEPFSIPADAPLLGRWTHTDVHAFLEAHGFEASEVSSCDFHAHDLSAIDAYSHGVVQTVIPWAARRTSRCPPDRGREALSRFFRGDKEPLFAMRARIQPGAELSFMEGVTVSSRGGHPASCLVTQAGPHPFVREMPRPILGELRDMLLQFDGSRTVREAHANLPSSEEDFILALRSLVNIGVIELI
jgi:SAM-dependent methyltransferase